MFGKIKTWGSCRMYQKLPWMHRANWASQSQDSIFLKMSQEMFPCRNILAEWCSWLHDWGSHWSVSGWAGQQVPSTLCWLPSVTACVRRSGSAGARWRLWHVPMWGMFSARPPRTASLVEQAKSSTKTTGVWLKSGWTISKISSILSHQVQRCDTEHKAHFSLASSEISIVGKVDLSNLRVLRPMWRSCAPWYYKVLRKDSFCSHPCLIYEFLPLLCPAFDFYTTLVISKPA